MLFRIPKKTADGILACTPPTVEPVPTQVREYLEEAQHLRRGEDPVAAIDDSILENGSVGIVLTDRRLFRYKKDRLLLELDLDDVTTASVRRMWYPSVPLVGRGGQLGPGPIVVLRFRFEKEDGAQVKLRLSEYAGNLAPFLGELINRFGERFNVRRTLPGI